MNEGYVYMGDTYIKYEKDLVVKIRERMEFPERNSDEFLLNEAHSLEEYYYTEWEDQSEYQYVMVNGKLEEIEQ